MSEVPTHLERGDALIVVDVQNDFCPDGALPIEEGHAIVPILNRWLEAAIAAGIPVYASRDWHPAQHLSFQQRGGPWPPHCLQDTEGARFHPDLALPDDVVKVTKGVRFDQDQNSAFDETGLAHELREQGVSRLWLGGLAQDVCVVATALEGRQAGFEVFLIEEATRPATAQGGRDALQRMKAAGVRIVAPG